MATLEELSRGLPLDPLPPFRPRDPNLPHAPNRKHTLNANQKKLALKNALRYFPARLHAELAIEFYDELQQFGHIYMYRFRPTLPLRAYPIWEYPARTKAGAALLLMVMNNLDPQVAQYPEELVTYGGNGQVLSNWAQFRILCGYLCQMGDDQTLSLYSGHPMGLFPSAAGSTLSPRAVITNGLVVPSAGHSRAQYDDLFALGVTQFGQMTAGSFCYIGPQGIVHGTTITVVNAARKYLHRDTLEGVVYVTSGLGGMSGAQAKAAVIAGCVGVVAEVDPVALNKRHAQGWLTEVEEDLDLLVEKIRKAKAEKRAVSIGYLGNAVSLWERLADEHRRTGEILAELGSDQTSLHDPFGGGYWPVQLPHAEAKKLLVEDPDAFKGLVEESLRRQVAAINHLAQNAALHFWDYGNAFLLEASRAGAPVDGPDGTFRYPSYVQHIMGDVFSLGFGPFRWVCCSGDPEDLRETDLIAARIMEAALKKEKDEPVAAQLRDNLMWIREAEGHALVVGSQARILYADAKGRADTAVAFNQAIRDGRIKGEVVISRDHHDVSGTDSPYRETSNITDGSSVCADMAVHNFVGGAFRGATWVALHHGGGVGWGEVINGGFGLLLDGSDEAFERARTLLPFDVNNGVARRCWAGNENARLAINRAASADPRLAITLPHTVLDDSLLDKLVQ
ncbi:urocanate hydratase-like [Neocloeon triangulifer]|uniref:urocanate hydratase-like n=1 Tax=Neocloeon triangulifer TaxID=2078957 RepID=UPI00286FAAF5|nr:urocanate hydratase-like [Neocloeon triangulifer]